MPCHLLALLFVPGKHETGDTHPESELRQKAGVVQNQSPNQYRLTCAVFQVDRLTLNLCMIKTPLSWTPLARLSKLGTGREILYTTTSWKWRLRLRPCHNQDKSFSAPPPLGGGGGGGGGVQNRSSEGTSWPKCPICRCRLILPRRPRRASLGGGAIFGTAREERLYLAVEMSLLLFCHALAHRIGVWKKHSPGEDHWEDKPNKHKIRGWIGVYAAALQGEGSPKRNVFWFTDTRMR